MRAATVPSNTASQLDRPLLSLSSFLTHLLIPILLPRLHQTFVLTCVPSTQLTTHLWLLRKINLCEQWQTRSILAVECRCRRHQTRAITHRSDSLATNSNPNLGVLMLDIPLSMVAMVLACLLIQHTVTISWIPMLGILTTVGITTCRTARDCTIQIPIMA